MFSIYAVILPKPIWICLFRNTELPWTAVCREIN